ncbi:MAG: hypothetical protein ACOY3H_04230 [Bacillota bacterium]
MFEPVWQWLKTRNKRFWAMSMAWLRWLGYGGFLYLTAMDKSEDWWQLALLGWLVLLGLQYLRYLRAPLHGPMMWMVFLGELGYLVWLTAHHSGQAGALIIFYYLHLLTILLAYEQLEAALMFMVHQGVVLIAYYSGWISGEFLARYLLGLLVMVGANFWQWDKIIRERQFWTAKRNYQRLALRLADHSTRLLQHQLTENEYKDLLQEMLELLCGLPGGAVFRRQEQGTWELYLAFGVAVRGQQELLPLPRGIRTIRIEHIPYLLGELQELPVKFKGKKEKYAFAPLVNINQVPETLAPETGWRLARVIELWQQGPVLKAANRAYITGTYCPTMKFRVIWCCKTSGGIILLLKKNGSWGEPWPAAWGSIWVSKILWPACCKNRMMPTDYWPLPARPMSPFWVAICTVLPIWQKKWPWPWACRRIRPAKSGGRD